MLIDDDDKNLTRVMIGGAVLVNILVFAVGYDAAHQSAKKQIQPTDERVADAKGIEVIGKIQSLRD